MKTLSFSSTLLLIGAAVLFTGCTTRHNVRVHALAADNWQPRPGMTYQWISAIDGVAESDLFFQEVAGTLDLAMREKGFERANPDAVADMNIFVSAHLSQPMIKTRVHDDPIHLRHDRRAVVSIPVLNSQGQVVSYVHRSVWVPGHTEFVGTTRRSEHVTVFDKVLRMSARKPAVSVGQPGEELWNVSVALRSASTDYRSFLPYLLTAALPHIGTRTAGEIVIVIPENDPSVQRFVIP